MSDDDLIRRGDALNAIKPIYGWSITAAEQVWGAIAALPPVTVEALVAAETERCAKVVDRAAELFRQRMAAANIEAEKRDWQSMLFAAVQIAVTIREGRKDG